MLKFLRIITKDPRYEIEFFQEKKERGVSMYDILDKAVNKGIEQGIFDVISRMLIRGKSVQEVVDLTGYEETKVQEVSNTLVNR